MRGMMKWQPFKSLSGQYRVLEEHRIRKERVEKPELSEDEIEDINNLLVSLSKGDNVDISYYDDGRIIHCVDAFIQCDTIERKIVLKKKSIFFESLLSLQRA